MRIRSSSIRFGKQGLYRLIIFALAISLTLQAMLPASALAYTNAVDTSSLPIGAVNDHIRKVSEMYMVAACFRYASINNTNPGQYVETGDIFYSGSNSSTTASLGAYLVGQQGTAASNWDGSDSSLSDQLSNCDHGENWLQPIASDLGYTGQDWAVQVACAAGFYRGTSKDQSKGLYGNACLNAPATYNFYQANDQNLNAQNFIKATSAKIGGATLTAAEQYLYNVNTLLIGCGGTDSGNPVDTKKTDVLYAQQQSQISAGTAAGITVVNGNGKSATAVNEFYTFGSSDQQINGGKGSVTVKQANLSRTTYGMETGASQSSIPIACNTLLANSNKYAPVYLAAVRSGQLPNPTRQVACWSNGSATSSANCNNNSGGGSSCQISGIGWIVCPLAYSISVGVDATFDIFAKYFLTVQPLTGGSSDPLFGPWATFRNMANVAFVVVFLLIIYSQLTGVGISNYGVKRMLPRLVLGAIAVNLSYWICAVGVDVSNILGVSVKSLLDNLAPGGGFNVSWQNATATILTGTAVGALAGYSAIAAAGGFTALLWSFLPVLMIAILSIFVAVAVMAARQALIIVLVILAPLAFVAYLLPNTQKWFNRWRDIFLTMLLMFPMVSLLFGGSNLAAYIIAHGTHQMVVVLLALCIKVIPLALTPLLIKVSGAALGRVAGIVNNPGKGLVDRAKSYSKERAGLATKRGLAAENPGRMQRLGQRRDRTRRRRDLEGSLYEHAATSRWNEELARADLDQPGADLDLPAAATTGRAGQALGRVVAEALDKELRAAQAALQRELATVDPTNRDNFLRVRATSADHGEAERHAAMHEAARLGRDGVIRELQNQQLYPDVDQRAVQEAIQSNASSLVNKAPDLVKPPAAAFGSVTGADLASFSEHTAAAYMQHIEALHATATAVGATQAQINEYNHASGALESALNDVSRTPTLRAKFDGRVGRRILEEINRSPQLAAAVPTAVPGMIDRVTGKPI